MESDQTKGECNHNYLQVRAFCRDDDHELHISICKKCGVTRIYIAEEETGHPNVAEKERVEVTIKPDEPPDCESFGWRQ